MFAYLLNKFHHIGQVSRVVEVNTGPPTQATAARLCKEVDER